MSQIVPILSFEHSAENPPLFQCPFYCPPPSYNAINGKLSVNGPLLQGSTRYDWPLVVSQIQTNGECCVRLCKAVFCAGVLALCSSAAVADAWQEREILSRVREQLIRVNKLLDEAEHAGLNNHSRLRMEYVSIRADLGTVEQGILQYLSAPMDPAAIFPLDGGYTEYQRVPTQPRPDADLPRSRKLPEEFRK